MAAYPFPFPIREFPDRGAKWLLRHPAYLRHLLRILTPEVAGRLDFERLEPFPTELLSESLRQQLADLIFLVPFERTPEKQTTIFIMVEHQSTPSRVMRFRVLSYMMQLWEVQRQEWERNQVPEGQWQLRNIIPLVFYTGTPRWERIPELDELMVLPRVLSRFVPRFDLLFLNLKATPSSRLIADETAFGHLLRVMQQEDAPLAELVALLEEVIVRMEELTREDKDEWSRLLYYLLLLIYHRRPPEEHISLQSVVESHHRDRSRQEEIQTMGKTIAQHLIEEGRELGVKEGRELGVKEGRELGVKEGEAHGRTFGELEGRQLMLLNLLCAKFGELTPEVEQRVKALSVSELDQLAVQLIHAASLEELGLQ